MASVVARILEGKTMSDMNLGWMCFSLIESATDSDLTSKVVGRPLRAHTDARASPKFPPPMTAILTG